MALFNTYLVVLSSYIAITQRQKSNLDQGIKQNIIKTNPSEKALKGGVSNLYFSVTKVCASLGLSRYIVKGTVPQNMFS